MEPDEDSDTNDMMKAVRREGEGGWTGGPRTRGSIFAHQNGRASFDICAGAQNVIARDVRGLAWKSQMTSRAAHAHGREGGAGAGGGMA